MCITILSGGVYICLCAWAHVHIHIDPCRYLRLSRELLHSPRHWLVGQGHMLKLVHSISLNLAIQLMCDTDFLSSSYVIAG